MNKWSPEVKAAVIGPILTAALAVGGFLILDYHQQAGKSVMESMGKNIIRTICDPLLYFTAVIGLICFFLGLKLSRILQPSVLHSEPSSLSSGVPSESRFALGERLHRQLLTIDQPKQGESLEIGDHPVKGRYVAKPNHGEKFALFTRRGKKYWPQGRLLIDHDGSWSCLIKEQNLGETAILACQVDEAVYLWVDLYLEVGGKHNDWIGKEIQDLPEGIRVDQKVVVNITSKKTN